MQQFTDEQIEDAKRKQKYLLDVADELYRDLLVHRDKSMGEGVIPLTHQLNAQLHWIDKYRHDVEHMTLLQIHEQYEALLEKLEKRFTGHVKVERQHTAYSGLVILVGLLIAFIVRQNTFNLFGFELNASIIIFFMAILGFFVLVYWLKSHVPPKVPEVMHGFAKA